MKINGYFEIIICFFLLAVLTGCQPSEVTSARLYLKHGNTEKAIEQLEQAAEKYPENSEVHYLLGLNYGTLQRYQDMNREFDLSIQLSEKYQPAIIARREFYWTRYYDAGGVAFSKQNYDAAIENYKTAIMIDSSQTRAHKKLVLVYVDSAKLQQALDLYNHILLTSPDDLDLLASMANLYYNLKEYNHVVLILRRILNIAPDHPDAHANLALAYEKLGMSDEARDAFQRAIQMNPNDIDLVFVFAVHQYNEGNYYDSIRLFERVLKNRPGDFECFSNIASCYLSVAKQLRRQLQNAGERMLTTSEMQKLRDTAVLNYGKAIPYLEQALQIKSDYAVLWRHLGIAYIAIGEKQKGTTAFLKAESLQVQSVN